MPSLQRAASARMHCHLWQVRVPGAGVHGQRGAREDQAEPMSDGLSRAPEWVELAKQAAVVWTPHPGGSYLRRPWGPGYPGCAGFCTALHARCVLAERLDARVFFVDEVG